MHYTNKPKITLFICQTQFKIKDGAVVNYGIVSKSCSNHHANRRWSKKVSHQGPGTRESRQSINQSINQSRYFMV